VAHSIEIPLPKDFAQKDTDEITAMVKASTAHVLQSAESHYVSDEDDKYHGLTCLKLVFSKTFQVNPDDPEHVSLYISDAAQVLSNIKGLERAIACRGSFNQKMTRSLADALAEREDWRSLLLTFARVDPRVHGCAGSFGCHDFGLRACQEIKF
jgi:hypothetical protein